ncbi:hypothetical protein [Peribacillus sp. Hz7]|uniref:hypothetical protein n=1 Tax=Peribacillus sp. Hz7 TaxID=3344873 RepID=UPI0035C9C37C
MKRLDNNRKNKIEQEVKVHCSKCGGRKCNCVKVKKKQKVIEDNKKLIIEQEVEVNIFKGETGSTGAT